MEFNTCLFVFIFCCTVRSVVGIPIDQLITSAAKSTRAFEFLTEDNPDEVTMELDMVLPLDQWKSLYQHSTSGPSKRKAISDKEKVWPGAVIPYTIDPSFVSDEAIEVHKAFQSWAVFTCLVFRPALITDVHKVTITNGDGCKSYVGRHTKEQFLYLSEECRKESIITHELGHTLGLYHEQSRPDRDNHVIINWDNLPDVMDNQFEKVTWDIVDELGVPYDYKSIMHYGNKAFSMNNEYTIVTADEKFQEVIGNVGHVSFRDVKTISLMYGCGDQCPEKCPGEGFHGKDCVCLCPGNPVIQLCVLGGTENDAGGTLPSDWTPPEKLVEPCKDSNSKCVQWSSEGQCDRNSGYMHQYCRKACGLCVVETCIDMYPMKCGFWARIGECENNPGYMLSYCKKSCNACGLTEGDLCVDTNTTRCQHWQSLGYCDTPYYADHMANNCRKTCSLCGANGAFNGLAIQTAPNAAPKTECADLDPNCQKFKAEGACLTSPEYMAKFCGPSCRLC